MKNKYYILLILFSLFCTWVGACPMECSPNHFVRFTVQTTDKNLNILKLEGYNLSFSPVIQEDVPWYFSLFGLGTPYSVLGPAHFITTDENGSGVVTLFSVQKYQVTITDFEGNFISSHIIYPSENYYIIWVNNPQFEKMNINQKPLLPVSG